MTRFLARDLMCEVSYVDLEETIRVAEHCTELKVPEPEPETSKRLNKKSRGDILGPGVWSTPPSRGRIRMRSRKAWRQ